MVAKIKSSFLKNSFQLFCYKNLISKDHNNTTNQFNNNNNNNIQHPASGLSSTSSSGVGNNSYAYVDPLTGAVSCSYDEFKRIKSTHSTSSPNLNSAAYHKNSKSLDLDFENDNEQPGEENNNNNNINKNNNNTKDEEKQTDDIEESGYDNNNSNNNDDNSNELKKEAPNDAKNTEIAFIDQHKPIKSKQQNGNKRCVLMQASTSSVKSSKSQNFITNNNNNYSSVANNNNNNCINRESKRNHLSKFLQNKTSNSKEFQQQQQQFIQQQQAQFQKNLSKTSSNDLITKKRSKSTTVPSASTSTILVPANMSTKLKILSNISAQKQQRLLLLNKQDNDKLLLLNKLNNNELIQNDNSNLNNENDYVIAASTTAQQHNSQNRHSYPIFQQTENNAPSNRNNPDLILKTESSNNPNSNLYKNQSIASLKLAKRIQILNRDNSHSKSPVMNNNMNYNVNTSKQNGENVVFKSSILSTNNNRRSFSAAASHAKKVVRFADALGLELESIITLNQMDSHLRRLSRNMNTNKMTNGNNHHRDYSNYSLYQNYINGNPTGEMSDNNNIINNGVPTNNSNSIEHYYNLNINYSEFIDGRNKYFMMDQDNQANDPLNLYDDIINHIAFGNSGSHDASVKDNYTQQENSNNNIVDGMVTNINQMKIRNNGNSNSNNDSQRVSKMQKSNCIQQHNSSNGVSSVNTNGNNNNSNNSNITITTRINNGKLESEV